MCGVCLFKGLDQRRKEIEEMLTGEGDKKDDKKKAAGKKK